MNMKHSDSRLLAIGAFYDYPVVKRAGRDFHQVPLRVYREALPEQVPDMDPDVLNSAHVLVEAIPKDAHMDFPGKPLLESVGSYFRSGVASHQLGTLGPLAADKRGSTSPRFAATDLFLLDETDLYFECASVFTAHGWADRGGGLSDAMLNKVVEIEGADFIENAKEAFGEDGWRSYAGEVAARHFAEPFSRLWYAANLQSLYYARHDDLRLGYLLAEYRIKMSYELFALRHIEITEKNRESGAKGGQAEKKRERYRCLDRLARQHFKEMAFASDKDAMRLAKRLAAEHDAEADEPLFGANGKTLSRDWFEEWLRHFRQTARGVE
jgi:hypothetical protein